MKKTLYNIQTNKGIISVHDMNEKHGAIVIHRPQYTNEKFWIIAVLGFQITTAKKISQAREIAKFLKQYCFINDNAVNYYKKHQEKIKEKLFTMK